MTVSRDSVRNGQQAVSAVMNWLLWSERSDFVNTFGEMGVILHANWLMDKNALRFYGYLSTSLQRRLVRAALEKSKDDSNG